MRNRLTVALAIALVMSAFVIPDAHAAGPGQIRSQLAALGLDGQGASDGQALLWNATTQKWEPGSAGGSVDSDALDALLGSTRGSIAIRGASGWTILAPGTSGYVLTSNGAGSDPSYQAAGAGVWSRSGTVLSPATSGDTVQVGDGTAAAPAYSFSSETGLGLARYTAAPGHVRLHHNQSTGGGLMIVNQQSAPTGLTQLFIYNSTSAGTATGGVGLYSLPNGYADSGMYLKNRGYLISDGNLSGGLVVGTTGGTPGDQDLCFALAGTIYARFTSPGTEPTWVHSSDTVIGWSSTSGGTGMPSAANDTQLKRTAAGVLGVFASGSTYGKLALASGVTLSAGSGSPESAVTASVGALFLRTNGSSGTTLYTKTSGTGNTGWEVVGGGGYTGATALTISYDSGSPQIQHSGSSYDLLIQGSSSSPNGAVEIRGSTVSGNPGAQVYVNGGGATWAGSASIYAGVPTDGSAGNVYIAAFDGVGTNRNGGSILTTIGEGTGAGGAGAFVWSRHNGGASVELARIKANGDVVLRSTGSALATDATAGFTFVPACAGTPTGTPASVTGAVAICADSTNNKLYIYSGGAWVALN